RGRQAASPRLGGEQRARRAWVNRSDTIQAAVRASDRARLRRCPPRSMSATGGRFRSSPDALAERVGDEMVVVDLKTDRIYSLNKTAARIWELLCGDCDRSEIERRILEEFDVTPAELAEAIDDLVGSMTRSGLLVSEP